MGGYDCNGHARADFLVQKRVEIVDRAALAVF